MANVPDLVPSVVLAFGPHPDRVLPILLEHDIQVVQEIGRASCRERV